MEKFTSHTDMYISLTGLSLGAIVATDFPQTTIYDSWTSHKRPTKMRRFSGRLQELSNRESLSKGGPDTDRSTNMSYVFDVGTERGHVVAAQKRSQIGVFHWPQTILKQLQEWRHCFLRPIRRDLTTSSYTTHGKFFVYSELVAHGGST